MKSYNWALIQYFLCPDKKRELGHRQHWHKDAHVRMQWEGSHWRAEERGLVCTCSVSCVQFFATPWTIARQTPLSMGFSRQEYCSGLPCPPLGDLPDPGIEPKCLLSPALAGGFFTTSATWEAPELNILVIILSLFLFFRFRLKY